VLRHLEGYELAEIANALDCSLATVKRELASAHEEVLRNFTRDPVLARYAAAVRAAR
jgi:RNA polymerase sigma-70 factor (ECF subfamily)